MKIKLNKPHILEQGYEEIIMGLPNFTALILASGKATRLARECAHVPKCLLQFNGIPFLHYLINWINNSGISNMVITTCAHSCQIKKEVEAHWLSIPIQVTTEKELINTVSSSYAGLQYVGTEHVLIIVADTIFETSLQDICKLHIEKNLNGVVLLTKRRGMPDYLVKVLDSGQIISMRPGLESNLPNHYLKASTMGLYTAKTDVILRNIDLDNDTSFDVEPFHRLLPEIWSYWCEGMFLDYGTPERLSFLRENPSIIRQYYGNCSLS